MPTEQTAASGGADRERPGAEESERSALSPSSAWSVRAAREAETGREPRTQPETPTDTRAGTRAGTRAEAQQSAGTPAGSSSPGTGPHGNRSLDRVDRAILRLLQQDGRASVRSVAERVHVSRANAYARIARMTEDGVIRGFTARVDHERAGQGASAYITLKIVQNSWRTVREQLLALPGVEHIALVSGEFDVLLLVHTADNRALRDLVLNRIQSLPAVLGTQTLLVFEETDQVPALPER
jgi:DNA-binding Lrp family transcriptional regulator